MQLRFSLAQKIRIAATLIVIFLVVLATNLMDNQHYSIVQKCLTTVYEDRLVAKDYLYKINKQLQLKRSAFLAQDKQQLARKLQDTNDSIQVLVDKYANTKLTPEEAIHFESLQANLKQLQQFEANLLNNNSLTKTDAITHEAEPYFIALIEDLDVLSQIQLKEGKREINTSNHAINSSNLISRIEMGLLILIGFTLQLLIFVKPLK